MLKTIIERQEPVSSTPNWLDVTRLARVEIISEDSAHPIEAALLLNPGSGWRAGQPGAQTIRLLFEAPQWIQRIRLEFIEEHAERLQELVLRWRPQTAAAYHEIVRQQYVFSPGGSTCEVEDYSVDLKGLVALELWIDPDVGRNAAFASLQSLRLA